MYIMLNKVIDNSIDGDIETLTIRLDGVELFTMIQNESLFSKGHHDGLHCQD